MPSVANQAVISTARARRVELHCRYALRVPFRRRSRIFRGNGDPPHVPTTLKNQPATHPNPEEPGQLDSVIMPHLRHVDKKKSLLEKILIYRCIYRIICATEPFQQGGTIT